MEKTITTTELAGMLQVGNPVTLLDVRRKEDLEKSPAGIAGALWHDPSAVAEWVHTLPSRRKWYCIVSRAVRSVNRCKNS